MKKTVSFLLYGLYVLSFLIPGYTYFIYNQNLTTPLYQTSTDLATRLLIVFRLFGLYAFHLVWTQVMISSFNAPLTTMYGPKVDKYYKFMGLFAVLFSLAHLGLFSLSYKLHHSQMWIPWEIFQDYLGPLWFYGVFGEMALLLIIIALTTNVLRNHPFLQSHWKKIHLVNYGTFVLAFIHSLKIGTDVDATPMQFLYGMYAVSYMAGILYQRIPPFWTKVFPKKQVVQKAPFEIKE